MPDNDLNVSVNRPPDSHRDRSPDTSDASDLHSRDTTASKMQVRRVRCTIPISAACDGLHLQGTLVVDAPRRALTRLGAAECWVRRELTTEEDREDRRIAQAMPVSPQTSACACASGILYSYSTTVDDFRPVYP